MLVSITCNHNLILSPITLYFTGSTIQVNELSAPKYVALCNFEGSLTDNSKLHMYVFYYLCYMNSMHCIVCVIFCPNGHHILMLMVQQCHAGTMSCRGNENRAFVTRTVMCRMHKVCYGFYWNCMVQI